MFVRPINLPTVNPNEMPSSVPNQRHSNYIMLSSFSRVAFPKMDILESIQLTDSKLITNFEVFERNSVLQISRINRKSKSFKGEKILNNEITSYYENKQIGKPLVLFHHEKILIFRWKVFLYSALARLPSVIIFICRHYLYDIPADLWDICLIASLATILASYVIRFSVCRLSSYRILLPHIFYTLLVLATKISFDMILFYFRFDVNNFLLLSSLPLIIHYAILIMSFIATLFDFTVSQIFFAQLILVLATITALPTLSSSNKWEPLIFVLLGSLAPIMTVNIAAYSLDIESYEYFSNVGLMELWFRIERAIFKCEFKSRQSKSVTRHFLKATPQQNEEAGEPEGLLSSGRRF